MRSHFLICFLMILTVLGCSSAPKDVSVDAAASGTVTEVSVATPTEDAKPADTDTVDSLSQDSDKLQRELIQYTGGPLTPKQEDEVEIIKKKIQKKESKKANLELQKMLGELKEE